MQKSLWVMWVTFITLLLNFLSQTIATKYKQKSYIAAVVEYQPITESITNKFPQTTLELNSDKFVEFIAEAKTYGADIIIFPEYALTSLNIPTNRLEVRPFLVPIPEIGENPCLSKNSFSVLRKLSCAAKSKKIYVVFNLGEIHQKSSKSTFAKSICNRDDKTCHFNTNVVLNRNGEIIAKYHKNNLYFETQFDVPVNQKCVTFNTDFGVLFGTFICFDLMFENPSIYLRRNGVRNFIATMAWVDELPFLTAIQSGSIWAMSTGANLLLAGYHEPRRGSLGSGIFSGAAGPLNYTYDPNSGSKLIVTQIPVDPYDEALSPDHWSSKALKISDNLTSNFVFLKEDLRNYSSLSLKAVAASEVTICHQNLCCSLKYKYRAFKASKFEDSYYTLVAFSGFRKTARETAEFGWEVCSVTQFFNDKSSLSRSLKVFPNFLYFELSVTGYQIDPPMTPSLSTLDYNFQPIPFAHFKFTATQKMMTVASRILPKINVHTIALVNRIY